MYIKKICSIKFPLFKFSHSLRALHFPVDEAWISGRMKRVTTVRLWKDLKRDTNGFPDKRGMSKKRVKMIPSSYTWCTRKTVLPRTGLPWSLAWKLSTPSFTPTFPTPSSLLYFLNSKWSPSIILLHSMFAAYCKSLPNKM